MSDCRGRLIDTAAPTGRAAKHKHWFTAFWWNFGPYGRQDVHVHSCVEGEPGDCDRVVVGEGRDCDPKVKHWRETLRG